MSRTLWGIFDHKVDQKGRVSVPADYRRVIEAGDPSFGQGRRPQLAIVYGLDDDYLVGYTIEEITKYEERIGKMRNSPLKRQLVRRLISKSFRTEIDNDGRLVLPQERREQLKLEGEVTFVGALGTFQMWRPDTYLASEAADDAAIGDDMEGEALLDAMDEALAELE